MPPPAWYIVKQLLCLHCSCCSGALQRCCFSGSGWSNSCMLAAAGWPCPWGPWQFVFPLCTGVCAMAALPTLCLLPLLRHMRGIIHRDLKSPNLLVEATWRVKVAGGPWSLGFPCLPATEQLNRPFSSHTKRHFCCPMRTRLPLPDFNLSKILGTDSSGPEVPLKRRRGCCWPSSAGQQKEAASVSSAGSGCATPSPIVSGTLSNLNPRWLVRLAGCV